MNQEKNELPHWTEFKKKYPDGLLSGNQIASILNKRASEEFYSFLENQRFDEFVYKKDVHFVGRNRIAVPEGKAPQLLSKIKEVTEEFNKLLADSTLIHDDEDLFRHPKRKDLLRIKISNGEWSHLIYGTALNPTGREMIFFKKHLIEETIEKTNLKSFLQISQSIPGFPSETTLHRMYDKGDITQPEPLRGTNLWEVEDLIKQINNRGSVKPGSKRKQLLLPPFLEELFQEYAYERTNGSRIKDPFGTTGYRRKITNPDEHIRVLREPFYKICCHRAGIDIRNRALYEQGKGFRELTMDERIRFEKVINTF